MQENRNISIEEQFDSIERMYPASYVSIYPHVHKIANMLSDSEVDNVTEQQVDNYTENVYSYFSGNPKIDNNFLFRDLIKILILRELFERHRQRRFFPSSVNAEDSGFAQSVCSSDERIQPQRPNEMELSDEMEKFFNPVKIAVENTESADFTYNESTSAEKKASSFHISEINSTMDDEEHGFSDEPANNEFKGWY